MVTGCVILGHLQLYQHRDDLEMFSTLQMVQQQQLLRAQRRNLEDIHACALGRSPSQVMNAAE